MKDFCHDGEKFVYISHLLVWILGRCEIQFADVSAATLMHQKTFSSSIDFAKRKKNVWNELHVIRAQGVDDMETRKHEKINEIHIHAGLGTQTIWNWIFSNFYPIFIVFSYTIFNLRRHSIFDQSINQTNEYIQKFIAWSALNWRDFVFACFFRLFLLTTIQKSIGFPFNLRWGKFSLVHS